MSVKELSEDKEYDLSKSKEKLGALVPVIKDAHGNIIDGFTRKSIDPDWPEVTSDLITDPIQLECSRLATNFARRTKWTEDDVKRLNFIAETTGWKPKEIAENTGISYRTIMKYISEEFKERPGVGGPVAHVQLKPEEVEAGKISTQKVHDFGKPTVYACGFPDCQRTTYYPTFYENVPICPYHDEQIQKDPSLAEKLKEKPTGPRAKTEKKLYKPTWQERKEKMHPKESKMDWDIFLLAQANPKIKAAGYRVVFQKEYVLVVTKSDLTLEKIDGSHEKAFFWDHIEIHKNRRDRDAYLRGLLERRYPHAKVIGVDYHDNTKQSIAEIMQEIVGAVQGEQ